MNAQLQAEIDALPGACRTVFVLCALEGLSPQEAGAALGLDERAVIARYARAQRLLGVRGAADAALDRANVFAFEGERCERIVAAVLARLPNR